MTALLGFAPPCRGAQSEISLELYVYPLKAPPARAGEVAGFLSPERVAELNQRLVAAQPLLTSSVSFALPDDAVVDAPISCTPHPGARLGSTRARVIIQLEPREISLSGSVIMHPADSPNPFLRSFSAIFPRRNGYTFCIRGMFFIVSDQLLEGIVLIREGFSAADALRPKRPYPRLPLEPNPATGYPESELYH